jgi:hypothetical protein
LINDFFDLGGSIVALEALVDAFVFFGSIVSLEMLVDALLFFFGSIDALVDALL